MRLNLLSILAYLINTLYGRLRMFQWPVGHWLTVQLCCWESLCQTWETEPQIFLLLHVSPGLSLIVHLLTHLLSCQKSNSKQGRLCFEVIAIIHDTIVTALLSCSTQLLQRFVPVQVQLLKIF